MEALSIFEHFNSKVLTIAGDYRFCETFCQITAGISPLVIWKICRIIFHVCVGVKGAPRVLAPSLRSLTHILFGTKLGNTQRSRSGAEPRPVTLDKFHILRGFLTERLPRRPHRDGAPRGLRAPTSPVTEEGAPHRPQLHPQGPSGPKPLRPVPAHPRTPLRAPLAAAPRPLSGRGASAGRRRPLPEGRRGGAGPTGGGGGA